MSLKEQLNLEKLPQHVAIIMDGNGRWARKHGFARTIGHKSGVTPVREVVEASGELGIKFLTLYAFSTENWSRPIDEIQALMGLLVNTIKKESKKLMKNNVRLLSIGDREKLPASARKELELLIEESKTNTGLSLVLALSYSSRWEILEAVKRIAQQIENKELSAADINKKLFEANLSTAGIPDPELLIRTSGEYRISNFLLYQIAYSELYYTDILWPDFKKEDFYQALLNFQNRERRFGKTSEQV